MPLPLPLIGSALALLTGAVLLRDRREPTEDGDSDDDSTALSRRHLVTRLANTRLTLRGQLRSFGSRRLELWEDVLRDFAHIRKRIKNLPHSTSALCFGDLPALSDADLVRMVRGGDVVASQDAALLTEQAGEDSAALLWSDPPALSNPDARPKQWQDVLPTVSLLGAAALGRTPLDPLGPAHLDSPTLAWLAEDELTATAGPLLGGLTLGADAQASLRGEAGSIQGDRELRALLAAVETTQIIAESLMTVTQDLDHAAREAMSELWLLVQINDDYNDMSDLALPTVRHAPRRIVERAHHLVSVLLLLCEAELLAPDGTLRNDIQETLDIADAAATRYA